MIKKNFIILTIIILFFIGLLYFLYINIFNKEKFDLDKNPYLDKEIIVNSLVSIRNKKDRIKGSKDSDSDLITQNNLLTSDYDIIQLVKDRDNLIKNSKELLNEYIQYKSSIFKNVDDSSLDSIQINSIEQVTIPDSLLSSIVMPDDYAGNAPQLCINSINVDKKCRGLLVEKNPVLAPYLKKLILTQIENNDIKLFDKQIIINNYYIQLKKNTINNNNLENNIDEYNKIINDINDQVQKLEVTILPIIQNNIRLYDDKIIEDETEVIQQIRILSEEDKQRLYDTDLIEKGLLYIYRIKRKLEIIDIIRSDYNNQIDTLDENDEERKNKINILSQLSQYESKLETYLNQMQIYVNDIYYGRNGNYKSNIINNYKDLECYNDFTYIGNSISHQIIKNSKKIKVIIQKHIDGLIYEIEKNYNLLKKYLDKERELKNRFSDLLKKIYKCRADVIRCGPNSELICDNCDNNVCPGTMTNVYCSSYGFCSNNDPIADGINVYKISSVKHSNNYNSQGRIEYDNLNENEKNIYDKFYYPTDYTTQEKNVLNLLYKNFHKLPLTNLDSLYNSFLIDEEEVEFANENTPFANLISDLFIKKLEYLDSISDNKIINVDSSFDIFFVLLKFIIKDKFAKIYDELKEFDKLLPHSFENFLEKNIMFEKGNTHTPELLNQSISRLTLDYTGENIQLWLYNKDKITTFYSDFASKLKYICSNLSVLFNYAKNKSVGNFISNKLNEYIIQRDSDTIRDPKFKLLKQYKKESDDISNAIVYYDTLYINYLIKLIKSYDLNYHIKNQINIIEKNINNNYISNNYYIILQLENIAKNIDSSYKTKIIDYINSGHSGQESKDIKLGVINRKENYRKLNDKRIQIATIVNSVDKSLFKGDITNYPALEKDILNDQDFKDNVKDKINEYNDIIKLLETNYNNIITIHNNTNLAYLHLIYNFKNIIKNTIANFIDSEIDNIILEFAPDTSSQQSNSYNNSFSDLNFNYIVNSSLKELLQSIDTKLNQYQNANDLEPSKFTFYSLLFIYNFIFNLLDDDKLVKMTFQRQHDSIQSIYIFINIINSFTNYYIKDYQYLSNSQYFVSIINRLQNTFKCPLDTLYINSINMCTNNILNGLHNVNTKDGNIVINLIKIRKLYFNNIQNIITNITENKTNFKNAQDKLKEADKIWNDKLKNYIPKTHSKYTTFNDKLIKLWTETDYINIEGSDPNDKLVQQINILSSTYHNRHTFTSNIKYINSDSYLDIIDNIYNFVYLSPYVMKFLYINTILFYNNIFTNYNDKDILVKNVYYDISKYYLWNINDDRTRISKFISRLNFQFNKFITTRKVINYEDISKSKWLSFDINLNLANSDIISEWFSKYYSLNYHQQSKTYKLNSDITIPEMISDDNLLSSNLFTKIDTEIFDYNDIIINTDLTPTNMIYQYTKEDKTIDQIYIKDENIPNNINISDILIKPTSPFSDLSFNQYIISHYDSNNIDSLNNITLTNGDRINKWHNRINVSQDKNNNALSYYNTRPIYNNNMVKFNQNALLTNIPINNKYLVFYIVFRQTQMTTTPQWLISNNNKDSFNRSIIILGNDLCIKTTNSSPNAGCERILDVIEPNLTYVLCVQFYPYTETSNFFLNNRLIKTVNVPDISTDVQDKVVIGAYHNGTEFKYNQMKSGFQGYIYELIAINNKIDQTSRYHITNYLLSKWNVSMPCANDGECSEKPKYHYGDIPYGCRIAKKSELSEIISVEDHPVAGIRYNFRNDNKQAMSEHTDEYGYKCFSMSGGEEVPDECNRKAKIITCDTCENNKYSSLNYPKPKYHIGGTPENCRYSTVNEVNWRGIESNDYGPIKNRTYSLKDNSNNWYKIRNYYCNYNALPSTKTGCENPNCHKIITCNSPTEAITYENTIEPVVRTCANGGSCVNKPKYHKGIIPQGCRLAYIDEIDSGIDGQPLTYGYYSIIDRNDKKYLVKGPGFRQVSQKIIPFPDTISNIRDNKIIICNNI
jgi:hypothetical protein